MKLKQHYLSDAELDGDEDYHPADFDYRAPSDYRPQNDYREETLIAAGVSLLAEGVAVILFITMIFVWFIVIAAP
ncbi:hypothetical protein UFOVP1349_20 [uncultured Caudovirales phage]|uniref:Uncharacterized protein n=1 Tax=uncultured Caudovirales phage TaxID=2100421 RepID=A0A6J5SJ53_9CAUD|nr:hypothetical protein UFOVP925_23 [uncultured Caudovirales phage]CAB4184096.1 hypothetical protein UFOVP1097_26 [uncultured Caudovirales phage]CAB4199943.1 hypothetical protein UFOVP1349_20 [uncultured Caudovirales phage]CAB4214652.1 hypothetical protein UFOVP1456_57 [uncultured Caudovirales phage]